MERIGEKWKNLEKSLKKLNKNRKKREKKKNIVKKWKKVEKLKIFYMMLASTRNILHFFLTSISSSFTCVVVEISTVLYKRQKFFQNILATISVRIEADLYKERHK